MNNSNISKCFIPLHKDVSVSQVELKLTNLNLLDAHTLPTHGTAWRGRTSFNVPQCATSSLEDKYRPTVYPCSLCIYILFKTKLIKLKLNWFLRLLKSAFNLISSNQNL